MGGVKLEEQRGPVKARLDLAARRAGGYPAARKMADTLETPGDRARTVERVAVAVCRFVNERPGPKRAQSLYHRLFGDRVVRASIGRRARTHGLEHATG